MRNCTEIALILCNLGDLATEGYYFFIQLRTRSGGAAFRPPCGPTCEEMSGSVCQAGDQLVERRRQVPDIVGRDEDVFKNVTFDSSQDAEIEAK